MEYYVDYIWQDGLLTEQMLYYYLEVTIRGVTRTEKIPISSKFVYDESNQPVGCVANGEAAYAFVRNLQGDIIAVVGPDGEPLVEYSYDPWGKVTSTRNGENLTQLESSVIAVMCPFAYRGYNYDFTTGLYYLQSRYYNPEWGRFLNCDDTNILLATQGETLGANLFAYCNNNPVNRVDYTGRQSVPNRILIPTVLTAFYGLVSAPLSPYIMTMRDINLSYSYNENYDIVYIKSIWSTTKWYKYERFYITTCGGLVGGFRKLIDKIEKYITAYELLGLGGSVSTEVLMRIIAAKGGMNAILAKASKIAFAVSISVEVVMLMIGGAISKIEKETRGMSDSEWYMFNWRVDHEYMMILSERQSYPLYYYTPFALLYC